MKHIPAFAYLYNYYAIPEEYASADEFLTERGCAGRRWW